MLLLIEALKDRYAGTRAWAAGTLGRLGPQAKAATPGLRQALKDRNRRVRRAAAKALRRIKNENTVAVESTGRAVHTRRSRFFSALLSAFSVWTV
jgi:HEAT repeat protein